MKKDTEKQMLKSDDLPFLDYSLKERLALY